MATLADSNKQIDQFYVEKIKRMLQKLHYYLFLLLILFSCSKESKDENNLRPEADFTYYDELNRFKLTDQSSDPEHDSLSRKWSSNSNLVVFQDENNKTTYFLIPELTEPSSIDITLTIDDGTDQNSAVKSIELPVMNNVRRWGLGKELLEEVSNNTDYEWYIDQMNTGTYSGINCGPSSVTMSIKWADETFSKSAEDARNTYRTDGGWWYTNDIVNYLNLHSVNNKTISISNVEVLTNEIVNGNIIILCLDMYYISDEIQDDWHINKFYVTNGDGWGHFIVLKGYKVVDDELLFEFYDPYSYGKKYADHSIKGKDRYYSASDIDQATEIWWDYAIVISKNAFKAAEGLDINLIPQQFGR